MKLKPDEISVAVNAMADLLDRKGGVLVAAEDVTPGDGSPAYEERLTLDGATPALHARITVEAQRRGKADPFIIPGLYPVAGLAAFLTKREDAPHRLVRVTADVAGLTVRAADKAERTFAPVSLDRKGWPKAVPGTHASQTREGRHAKAELMEILDARVPPALDLGADVFDLVPAIRAIAAIRPPGVRVEHFPGVALRYTGAWFGVRFAVTLREGVVTTHKTKKGKVK